MQKFPVIKRIRSDGSTIIIRDDEKTTDQVFFAQQMPLDGF